MTLALLEGVSHQQPAHSGFDYPVHSATDSLVCYMQTAEGVILNLENLCGSRRVVKALSAKDRQFIEDYKKLLKGFPKAQAAMSGLVEGNPQAIIQKAAEVCNELRTGRYSEARITQPDADADILNSLAPEYYCTEFND